MALVPNARMSKAEAFVEASNATPRNATKKKRYRLVIQITRPAEMRRPPPRSSRDGPLPSRHGLRHSLDHHDPRTERPDHTRRTGYQVRGADAALLAPRRAHRGAGRRAAGQGGARAGRGLRAVPRRARAIRAAR